MNLKDVRTNAGARCAQSHAEWNRLSKTHRPVMQKESRPPCASLRPPSLCADSIPCRPHPMAPEIFDAVVVQRQAERREERRQWMARVEPVLQKVYGSAADPSPGKLHHDAADEWCRKSAVHSGQAAEDSSDAGGVRLVDDGRRRGVGTLSTPPAASSSEPRCVVAAV